MSKLFVTYATLLIPGKDNWPAYQDANSNEFWTEWKTKSPISTRFALAFSLLIIQLYCSTNVLRGRSKLESLAQMESAGTFLFRQAYKMLKSLACLAYFSDENIFQLASSHSLKEEGYRYRTN